MQKTNKLKRLGVVLLALVTLITCFAPAASALNVGTKVTFSHRDAYHGGLQSGENGTTRPGTRGTHYNNRLYWHEGWAIGIITLNGSGLKAQYQGKSYAYCVEHKVKYGEPNRYVTGNEDSIKNTDWWWALQPYQQKLVQRALPHMFPAMTPAELGVSSVDDAYASSQVILWEIVEGYRDASGKLINATYRDQYMKYAYTGYGHTKGEDTPAMVAYNNISNALITHKTEPSWKEQTIQLDWNETNQRYEKTITDTNGVLSQFLKNGALNVTENDGGVTLQVSGNNLTLSSKTAITAPATVQMEKNLKTAADTGNIALFGGKEGETAQKMIYGTMDDPVWTRLYVTTGSGTMKLVKSTTVPGGTVANIEFAISKTGWNNDQPMILKTDTNGEFTVELPEGKYRVEEITEFAGVEKPAPQTVQIIADKDATVYFENKPTETSFRLRKDEPLTGYVEGFPFRISRTDGSTAAQNWVYVAKSDETGEVLINNKLVTAYYKAALIATGLSGTSAINPAAATIYKEAYGKDVTAAIRQTAEYQAIWNALFAVHRGSTLQVVSGDYYVHELLWALDEIDGYAPSDWYGWDEENHEPWTICTVDTTSDGNIFYFANFPDREEVVILKECVDGEINDVEFYIERIDADGNVLYDLGTVTTRQDTVDGKTVDGVIYIAIEAGRYRITELGWEAKGYQEPEVKIMDLHMGDRETVTFENKPLPTPVEILKTVDAADLALGATVAGWNFTVSGTTYWGGTVYETGLTTDANGKINTTLYGGTYTITEVLTAAQKAQGFEQPASVTFTIERGQTEAATITFQNRRIKQPVQIIKTSDSGVVDGFHFSITGTTSDGMAVKLEDLVTDEEGLIYTQLWPGTYTVTEVLTAEQKLLYKQPAPQTFTVTAADAKAGTPKEVKFHNDFVEVDVAMQKKAPNGNVAGFTFRVTGTDSLGRAVNQTGITDESGYTPTITLIPGTYTVEEELTEEQAKIYAQPAPKTLTITAGMTSPVSVTFKNEVQTGGLKVIKTFEGRTTPIAGVPFTIIGTIADGRPYEQTFKTDAEGKIAIPDMPIGTYTIKELASPLTEDYILSEEETVSVAADKITEMEILNVLKKGSLTVRKVNHSGAPLAGAEYLLEKSTDNGSTWTAVTAEDCTSAGLTDGRLVTGADGIVRFTDLPANAGVMYRMTETVAPEGCELLANPLFEGTLPFDVATDNVDLAQLDDGYVIDGETVHVYHVSLTAVDGSTFDMPMSGGNGFLPVTAGTALLGLIAIVGALLRKKRATAC